MIKSGKKRKKLETNKKIKLKSFFSFFYFTKLRGYDKLQTPPQQTLLYRKTKS